MKAKILKEFIIKLNDNEDVLASWITRTDVNEWYCKDEPLTDYQWDIIEENIGYEGESLEYEINWARQVSKEDNENVR